MRTRTLLALVAVVAVLAGVAGYALVQDPGETLEERWVSDTPRDNQVNHHPVGAVGDVVVAPVAAVVRTEEIGPHSCSLVRLAPADGEVVWRVGVRPANCTTHALTGPALADVTGNGRPEVVAASTERALLVYGLDGREEFRVDLSTYGYGQPSVGNLTAAPGAEIVVSDIRGGVVAVRGNGTVAWRRALNASTWANPVVADVDGDRTPETAVTTNEETVLLDADGRVEWRTPAPGTTMAVADADDDLAREVFVTDVQVVRALDGRTGDVEWTVRVDGRVHAARDGDGDGRVELYVGAGDGRVVALDAATGERDWTTALVPDAERAPNPPVVGDLDGDGRPELVAVANDGTTAVLDPATGSVRATYERDVPVWTRPTLADLDGDGAADVLVRYGDGRVVALAYEA